jgi:hypothetical protein
MTPWNRDATAQDHLAAAREGSVLGRWANNLPAVEVPDYPAFIIAYTDGSGYLLSVHPAEARTCDACRTAHCLLVVRETGTPGVRTMTCMACDEDA